MAFTLSTAIQFAKDAKAAGLDPDKFLPRFTFFFDISISFFEEIAKFRAGRRIWARIVRERLGASNPRAWRFKFHAQTSGVDLTMQQPLNNIARVTAQAMAGILGGLQSLHTDAFDEVVSTPCEEAARVAVATQNILREEARLCDVIDPLGGSYYLETLTVEMEAEIEAVMDQIDSQGGMYRAVESGFVQERIGRSALAFQNRVESGAQKIVGVNSYEHEEDSSRLLEPERPDPEAMRKHLETFRSFKKQRDQGAVRRSLDALARSTEDAGDNVFGRVVDAAQAGATHGEIVACLRAEVGFGEPLIAA
jgi:methylmalonyl-CoA mutase N-terminal domain/subunit